MNFIAFIVLSILSVLGVQAHRADKKCVRELEAIVYTPKVCAYEYLKKITQTLLVNGPLLFVPDTAKPIFERFAQTFNVQVYAVDAFGVWYDYPGGSVQTLPQGVHLLDRAYALGEAFSNFNNAGKPLPTAAYVYGKIAWSQDDGEMYTIVVIADKAGPNSLTAAGCC